LLKLSIGILIGTLMADGDRCFPLISINTHSILNLAAGGVNTGGEGRSIGNIANMLPAIGWSISTWSLRS
jgi:hypothetical protein